MRKTAIYLDLRRNDGEGDRLVILAAPERDDFVDIDVMGVTGSIYGWKSADFQKGPYPSWTAAKRWLRRYLKTMKRYGYRIISRRIEYADLTWRWV